MERKIGEIFKYKGEWYQCIKEVYDCQGCCSDIDYFTCSIKTPCCSSIYREDGKNVIFKKLRKIGEPRTVTIHGDERVIQEYKLYDINFCKKDDTLMYITDNKHIAIEIKQDMKENRLKPFNIEEAKSGKPVYTRDGREVRIVCFDRNCDRPIIALIKERNGEILSTCYSDGRCIKEKETPSDIMLLSEKKEGWVNIYRTDGVYSTGALFFSEEGAKRSKGGNYVTTIKIEWEE